MSDTINRVGAGVSGGQGDHDRPNTRAANRSEGATARAVLDGVLRGDFSDDSSAAKTAAQIGLGFIPVAGQLADARDTASALARWQRGENGAAANLGFAVLGWLPAIGDFAKSVHKVGFRGTFETIGDAFRSIAGTWGEIRQWSDDKLGRIEGFFYRPATILDSDDLASGTLGSTNRFGDIEISSGLSFAEQESTLNHEKVHRFFSPSFVFGQEFRANVGLLGYVESHLLRRIEEGLAEAWAGFKRDGLRGAAEGWQFPYNGAYAIDGERIAIERNLLLGVTGSGLAAGAALGDAIAEADTR